MSSTHEKYEHTVEHVEHKKGNFFGALNSRYNHVDPHSYLRQENEGAFKYWARRLGQIKPVELLWGEAEGTELKRALSTFQLIFVGIGAIIGTGIFVLSGHAAGVNAGPAVTISFLIAAIASGKDAYIKSIYQSSYLRLNVAFAALSYSEMASMIPVAGSAYTYAYATMGEVRISPEYLFSVINPIHSLLLGSLAGI